MSVAINLNNATTSRMKEQADQYKYVISPIFLNSNCNNYECQQIFAIAGTKYIKYQPAVKNTIIGLIDIFKNDNIVEEVVEQKLDGKNPSDLWYKIPIYLVWEEKEKIGYFLEDDKNIHHIPDQEQSTESPVDYLGLYESDGPVEDADAIKTSRRIFLWVDRISKAVDEYKIDFSILFKHVLLHELMHALMDVYNSELPYDNFAKAQEEPLANALACYFDTPENAKEIKEKFIPKQPVPYCWSILYEDKVLPTLLKNWITVKANCK